MYLEHTPIEEYKVGITRVFVKRDDLFANPPAPPVAKLRGLRVILEKAKREGKTLIGCFEASQSRIGHGLAAACLEHSELSCMVVYAKVKNREPSDSIVQAQRLGAIIQAVPSNIVMICYRQATRIVESAGGWMLPFGFDCLEAVQAVEKEAQRIPPEIIHGGTVIVACGSGITLAGLLKGLPARPSKVIGVSVGRSVPNILKCLNKYLDALPDYLELRPATLPYRDRPPLEAPFPCDTRYDLKAWEVVVKESEGLRGPIVFWNVGG